MSYKWLEWAKRIQAISQAGLAFSKDPFDAERYEQLRSLSAEIINEHTDHDMEQIKPLFTNETGYQTPKVDIRGVVFQDNKILMVREKVDDHWSLPGGFCDIGLSASENITKEIWEESGFKVQPKKLLAVLHYDKHPHPPNPYDYYKLFIECEIIGGEATVGMETKGVAFYEEDQLPDLSVMRVTESQIHLMFDYLRDPLKPTCFD